MNTNVIKQSGIVQRGDKTFRFTVSCGFDSGGKHIRKTMTFKVPENTKPSKVNSVVIDAYRDFEKKCKGNIQYSDNMKFSELTKIYLAQYAKTELKDVTRYNYEQDLNLHILPVFGNKKANSITTADITNFLTNLNKAPETARKLRTVISSVFTFGKSQGYVSSNPCQGALYKTSVAQPKKVKYLNEEQSRTLMEATKEYSIVNTIIQFLLFTGLRIGECLGLTWDCVDFVNNTITVRNNLAFSYGQWYLSTPKTESSERTLTLGNLTMNLLRVHKQHQDEAKAIVGNAWAQPDVVFTSSIGNFFDRTYVNKYLKDVCMKNGLPPISVHKLRHTNASLMINKGFQIKETSARLGHGTIAITADIYGHVFARYDAQIADSLENSLL